MPDLFVAQKQQAAVPKKTEPERIGPEEPWVKESSFPSNPFLAFGENPRGFSFANQEEGEKIILLLRGHFITNLRWIITSIGLIVILIILILSAIYFPVTFSFLPLSYLIFAGLFYIVCILGYIFINFINWYYNVNIVTNKGIVDVDFVNLLSHNVTVTKLSLVEDITYRQAGFVKSILNYGDLYVQTAAEIENIEALGIPKPASAVYIIDEFIGEEKTNDAK